MGLHKDFFEVAGELLSSMCLFFGRIVPYVSFELFYCFSTMDKSGCMDESGRQNDITKNTKMRTGK